MRRWIDSQVARPAAGIAAAYLRGSINGIFVAPRELEDAFGLPVAGTVSLERAWQTNRVTGAGRSLTAMALAAILAGTTGIVAASHYPRAPDTNSVKIDLDNGVVASSRVQTK